MHYTIINFTRLGDLLQTQSTIAALKKSAPKGKHKISLICLEQFANAAQFIEELDDISILPSSLLLQEIHEDWHIAFQSIENWINEYYHKFPYSCIINLTPSMNCRIFAQYLSRKNDSIPMEGFALDRSGYGHNTSPWTSYIQAVTQERGCSPYNLIDGFRSMLNLAPEHFSLKKPSNTLREQAKLYLDQEARKTNDAPIYIGFQLGASNALRMWDLDNFAQLALLLKDKGLPFSDNKQNNPCIPVLLGSNNEIPLAERFLTKFHTLCPNTPVINLCGKTNLDELAAILCHLTALVSNDTGTLHLAVGLGTPVLGIYLATAQVWDTGPYGENHLCLEPKLDCHPCSFTHVCHKDHLCRKFISAQTVYESLCFLSNKKQNNILLQNQEARIWQSTFDNFGFSSYTSFSDDAHSNRTLWIHCQRLFYKNLLNRFTKTNHHLGTDYSTPFVLSLPDDLFFKENIHFIDTLAPQLLLLKEQATLLNLKPSTKMQENFLSSVERINYYFAQNKAFTPLFLLWKSLIQENAHKLDDLIHFFDTLHQELGYFKNYLNSITK